MREIGVLEAETTLGALLDLVETGEEVAITRDGKRVARLVPERDSTARKEAREAAARIKARREGMSLGGLTIKDLINEGRR